jgi:hypothetical protein
MPEITSRNFDQVLEQIISDTIVGSDNAPTQVDTPIQDTTLIQPEPNASQTSSDLNHKVDLILLNNGWNDKNERIVISVGENAASYKWMHEKCSQFYKTIDKILSIVVILFSTGLSAETIIPNSETNLAINILRRVFIYIITLISVIKNFLKYEQLSEQHMSSASNYAQLYHEIQQQMCMYRRDRQNATKYVTNILKTYDNLIVSGPSIPEAIIQKFKNTFKNSDISVPDIADKIQKIEIITEPQDVAQRGLVSKSVNIPTKRHGISNLNQIHQAFQIHGDISDNDLQNVNSTELRELRSKFLLEKLNFENARYLQHMKEFES